MNCGIINCRNLVWLRLKPISSFSFNNFHPRFSTTTTTTTNPQPTSIDTNRKLSIHSTTTRRNASTFVLKGLHEPEYLDYLKPQIPFYSLLNIQIKGYDFAVLESYGSYLHRLSNNLGLSVVKYWCAPYTTKKIETLEHESSVVSNTYELILYERNVQIKNISSRLASLLVEIVHRSLPVGVYLSIHEHDEVEHEQSRYIPDHQLVEFKSELKQLLSTKRDDDLIEDPKKKK